MAIGLLPAGPYSVFAKLPEGMRMRVGSRGASVRIVPSLPHGKALYKPSFPALRTFFGRRLAIPYLVRYFRLGRFAAPYSKNAEIIRFVLPPHVELTV